MICPGQTEACLPSFTLPVLIENNYVWNYSDNPLPLTWVGRDELGDEEAGRGPGHVHHGPRGLVEQSLVWVDASNAHGPVPDIKTEKGIVWELEGNWIDGATADCNTRNIRQQPASQLAGEHFYIYI